MIGELQQALRETADVERAVHSGYFFKCGPGQYGEGDQFIGNKVPDIRRIAKRYKDLPLEDLHELLMSPWHEERLVALFILILQHKKTPERDNEFYEFYLAHSGPVGQSLVSPSARKKWAPKNNFFGINNWDLVDSSAGYIVGPYLQDRPEKMRVLRALASSEHLWEKRIAMLSTFAYIVDGRPDEALEIAELLLHDPHDLIQKAVGWMLREIGKRCSKEVLVMFLAQHYRTMPRTALRYAIEHFSETERKAYLQGTA